MAETRSFGRAQTVDEITVPCVRSLRKSTLGYPENQILEHPLSLARRGGGWCAVSVDRKSTRLNSSHLVISYAVFCLKKKITMRSVETILTKLLIIKGREVV